MRPLSNRYKHFRTKLKGEPTATNMTRTFTCLLVFSFALAFFASAAQAQNVHRTFDVAAGSRLELDLETGGDITITGWDKNQVDITVTVEGRDKDDISFNIEQNSRGVEISSEFQKRRARADVNMVIRVPRKFDLEVSTTGGDVHVENIDGKIEGSSMGGDIVLTGLNGFVEFSTMGGDIQLTNSTVDGSVHTMGGDVDITDVTGSVQGTTMGGNVTQNNVKSGKAGSNSEVKINTMGGDVNVDEALNGADLHTMGGEIRVRKAAKFVKATTMGGDIDVDAIDGWIEANTMGGDIMVTMVGGKDGDRHVVLESMGGTIELTVPAGLSMAFDIEVKLTCDADDGEYTIESDFDVSVSQEKNRSDSRWKSGGVITGTGSVNGGRNKIKIRTTNGDVIIREGR